MRTPASDVFEKIVVLVYLDVIMRERDKIEFNPNLISL